MMINAGDGDSDDTDGHSDDDGANDGCDYSNDGGFDDVDDNYDDGDNGHDDSADFLHQQTVAIQGKALLLLIKGSVDILGYEVKQDSQTYKLFSPSSSSLLTMRECNKETNNTHSSSRLSEILSPQSAKLKKIALARTHKAASVLLMDGLQSLETDFITQYKEYDDILTKAHSIQHNLRPNIFSSGPP